MYVYVVASHPTVTVHLRISYIHTYTCTTNAYCYWPIFTKTIFSFYKIRIFFFEMQFFLLPLMAIQYVRLVLGSMTLDEWYVHTYFPI